MDAAAYIAAHQDRFLAQLQEFLRIQSISSLSEHRPDMQRAAEWLADDLRAIGLYNVEIISAAEEGHPLVYGEHLEMPGWPTLLLYGHYDVQPPDPLELWETSPFEPTIRGDNMYARGASDDKGQLLALLKGVEALLQGEGRLPINLKVLIEGEEEVSGRHIEQFVRANADRLHADAALVADSAMFAPGLPDLCTGLRGIVYTEIRVRGADHDLHSGQYGGVVSNPLNALAAILAGLKDTYTGTVSIPGFYDAVAPPNLQEREAWESLPLDSDGLRAETGAAMLFGEEEFSILERLWTRPTLDVHGLLGGFTGEGSKTVIPAQAMAKVSMRLVPDQDPETLFHLYERYVKSLCPPGVSVDVILLGHGAPVTLPADTPAMRAAAAALEETFGRPPAFTRMGGSIPIVETFLNVAAIPSVLAGFGLSDDNLHAPNEKLYLPNFFAAMRFTQLFFHRYGA